jgi:hypothetical protein
LRRSVNKRRFHAPIEPTQYQYPHEDKERAERDLHALADG